MLVALDLDVEVGAFKPGSFIQTQSDLVKLCLQPNTKYVVSSEVSSGSDFRCYTCKAFYNVDSMTVKYLTNYCRY